jgi:CO/xanthine dehydrogenase Mo-binding subunit
MATAAERESSGGDWIGKSVLRVEDYRLLRGRGRYVADSKANGLLEVAALRSPLAHALITSIDTSDAEKVPGVFAVLTGEDARRLTDPLSGALPDVVQYCLAVDMVRHVGEYVALVAAEDRYVAEDAIELIRVEYEELPPVADPFDALKDETLVHEVHGTNVAFHRRLTFGDVDRHFRKSDLVVSDTFRWNRHSGIPLETMGAMAVWDEGSQTMEILQNLQMPTVSWAIAKSLRIPASRLKLVPADVGGGFGNKMHAPKTSVIAGMVSRATGRPARFMEDRSDHMMSSDAHAEDRHYEASIAATRDGTILSLSIKVVDDYGAYFQFGAGTHANPLSQVTGLYAIESCRYEITAVLTNKCQQGVYRGSGAPPTNFILERLVDKLAREIGMDRVGIRRKNFIPKDLFPYRIPTGNQYDSGDYEKVLNMLLALSRYDELLERAERARKEGRYVGVGLSTTPDRSVFSATEFWFWFEKPEAMETSSPESASIKIDVDGSVTVFIHSTHTGTAAETVATQVVATELGVDPSEISVQRLDWHSGARSTGPAGSRLTVMLAGALKGAADRLKEKILQIASEDLEAHPEDLEFAGGHVRVKGSPGTRVALTDIAFKANTMKLHLPEGLSTGLYETFTYDHPLTTLPSEDRSDLGIFYPFMAQTMHVPVVEVDVETGTVTFLEYYAVHDCGTVVNPVTLDGQVLGATCQGIGGALFEELKYDENGQLLSTSLMDYVMPTAMEMPPMTVGHSETPSPYTYRGIKGAGEGGRMVAASAVASAIDHALSDFGIFITELPITPAALLARIEEARGRRT